MSKASTQTVNTQAGNTQSYDEIFTKEIVKLGRLTLLIAVPLSLFPGIYLWLRYGAIPPIKTIFTSWFMIASIYGVEYFMTPISYFPILGMSGTYMSFLSGNIANVRVPCALVAQDVVGVKSGTQEGELVATLGIAGSIITNLLVTTLAAIAGQGILAVLPEVVINAFDYVLPAIFGALFSLFAVQYPKYGVFAISLAAILVLVVKVLPTWLVVPICSFGTIAFAIYTSKKRNKKA